MLKVPKITNDIKVKTVNDDVKMKDKVEDKKESIVIEKENKYWCTQMSRSREGITKKECDNLSKFGVI